MVKHRQRLMVSLSSLAESRHMAVNPLTYTGDFHAERGCARWLGIFVR